MYDQIKIFSKTFGELDFAAAAATYKFRLPPGYTGRLLNVGLSVTTTFACDTTAGQVKVGTGADDDAYAILNIDDDTQAGTYFDKADDTDVIISAEPIPADTDIMISKNQVADSGTAAGKGYLQLDFEIWK